MDIVQSVLRAMPEQRRRAFILTRVEGLSHGDAARRLGISRPAVSKHVARAMDDLYAALHT
jgi:RNA polymerase sigma-70 factor (ECF subfamily)